MGDLPDWTTEVIVSVELPSPVVKPETAISKPGRYSGAALIAQEVCSWTITADKVGILKEITMIADEVDHAEFTVSIAGTALFTDKKFQSVLTLVFPDIKLAALVEIKVEVQSDDGTGIVVDAEISGKEIG